MLYSLICKPNQSPTPESLAAFVAQHEYCLEQQKKGKVKFVAAFSDLSGTLVILDVESHNEAVQILGHAPILPYVSAEMRPLVDMGAAAGLYKERIAVIGKK